MDQGITQVVQDRLGDNLRRLRKQAGLKQREVAVKLQLQGMPITREIYAQIEIGRRHIGMDVMRELKRIYKVSWEEMMEYPKQEEKSR